MLWTKNDEDHHETGKGERKRANFNILSLCDSIFVIKNSEEENDKGI